MLKETFLKARNVPQTSGTQAKSAENLALLA